MESMNKRKCFSKILFCVIVCVMSNGCVHLVVAKSMLDVVSFHRMNKLEKEVKQLKKDNVLLYGDKAIKHVEKIENRKLNEIEKHVVRLEGFSSLYRDTKNIPTIGVGQTGKYKDKTFKYTIDSFISITRNVIPSYDVLPLYLKKELVQAAYRGDLGFNLKATALFNKGLYERSAKEFLNNSEYKDSTTPLHIKMRMKAVSDAILKYAKNTKSRRLLKKIFSEKGK